MLKLREKLKKRFAVVAAVILAVAIMTAACGCGSGGYGNSESSASASDTKSTLKVHYLDVGQGDCTLLVSEGEAMLIDAGEYDDANYIINYIEDQGIEKLKYVIFTHPDSDHIGSARDVVRNFEIGKVFMQTSAETNTGRNLIREVRMLGIEYEMPKAEDEVSFGSCSAQFVGPIKIYDDTNSNSICTKVTCASNSFLFTGDAGVDQEDDMIDKGENLKTTVLKAAHHGSHGSSGYRLLREAYPEAVVISCGLDNQYGHPREETLSKISDLGADLYRTDIQGTIIAESNGRDVSFKTENEVEQGLLYVPGGSSRLRGARHHDETACSEVHHDVYNHHGSDSQVIGNANSHVYHNSSCRSLPKEHNRVYFDSASDAKNAGYRQCQNCY